MPLLIPPGGSLARAVFLLLSCAIVHLTDGQCFSYVTEHVGMISPYDVPVVKEGNSLNLNCTLDKAYALKHRVTSKDIFWQRKGVALLHSGSDRRLSLSYPDTLTAMLTLKNVTLEDSAAYWCIVRTAGGAQQTVCSVALTVAELPKKYKKFRCICEDLQYLLCTWQRGDPHTKYSLTYHKQGEREDIPCPDSKVPTASRSILDYQCMWKSGTRKGAEKLEKYVEKIHFMFGSTYYMTINGTNDLGTHLWHEMINPVHYVRPAAPESLTVVSADASSCQLKWAVETTMRGVSDYQSHVRFEVHYRKEGAETWQVQENLQGSSTTLQELDAHATYHINVTAVPVSSTAYSSLPATVTCRTLATVPGDGPGLVAGAYEEVGNGMQRQVTVYWKGLPERLQNGDGFHYDVYVKNAVMGEPRLVASTPFANQPVLAPSNQTTIVVVKPKNSKGAGPSEEMTIPSVRDDPLRIRFANVLKFSQSLYEVTWATNKPAQHIDIYWCRTSTSTHLAKCTYGMNHTTVDGSSKHVNISVDAQHQYRFAVSARTADGDYSGMTWKGQYCGVQDKEPWLDTLQVVALPNASIKVSWSVPCQHRFKGVKAYRVDFYPCREEAKSQCVQDKFETVYDESEHIVDGLLPDEGYCFEVSLMDNSSTDSRLGLVSKCLVTPPLPLVLPKGMIAGGVIGGGLLLFLIVFIGWCGIKRLRKDFRAIQKESRHINIPTSQLESYGDEYDKERSHYTKVDTDDQAYVRQLSDGIGSMESDEMTGKGTVMTLLPREESAAALLESKLTRSSDDLIVQSQADGTPDLSSPHLRRSPKMRPLDSAEKLHVLTSSRQNSAELPLNDSGISRNTQASSGYVVAASFQPSVSTDDQSSPSLTGDTGYTPDPSLSSGGLHSGTSQDSGASSGFAESEDSSLKRRSNECQALLWKSSATSEDSYLSQEDEDDSSGIGGTLDSPAIASTTKLLGNGGALSTAVPASGYVAWPGGR